MPAFQSPHQKAKAAVVLLLTFGSGMVDIVGYLNIYRLFVANMTGDTVRVGQTVITGDWNEFVLAGSVIVAFIAGSVVGRAVIEAGARKKIERIAGVTLLMEAALVLTVMLSYPASPLDHAAGAPGTQFSLVLLALAMGLQTATLTHLGPLTIHTTFVTGMLNQLAESLATWFFWLHDQWQQNLDWFDVLRRGWKRLEFQTATFMAVIWLCYAFGSVSGTWLNSHWRLYSLSIPVILLLFAAGIDQVQPISLEEEKR